MCGICGIASSEADYPINRDQLLTMRDSMVSRGPDDAGVYLSHGVGLGSRRLSILDLSDRGHMPMHTSEGRFSITYNGEVYNYRELRSELESRGYEFQSNSDTEVVLKSYAAFGPAMLDRFNGMFAIAIWDSEKRILFLARDRLGIKPLYYAVRNEILYFASEAKALFAAGLPREFDSETWEELLCFRYVAGEKTPYLGIKRLLPGHYLTWQNGQITTRRWWHLGERARNNPVPGGDAAGWFRATFEDSVNARRISDVPIGVLLSGGLDSSSVAATLAGQAGSGIASFTVRFAEPRYDEGPLAREVAQRWNLDHHELTLAPAELLDRLYQASFLNDEPLAHGNDLYLWAISQMAKPLVTVLLSGEGGDETLGGYVRYRPLLYPGLLRAARPIFSGFVSTLGLNGRLKKLSRFLQLGRLEDFILLNSCDVLPTDLAALGMTPSLHLTFRRQMLEEAQQTYPGDLFRQAMYSDHHTFLCSILDRNDRMTLGASIEGRVPFLDYRLVEGLASLPTSTLLAGKQSKPLLRRAMGDRLPQSILKHQKWGFAVPWTTYLRQVPELRDLVESVCDAEPIRNGPFDKNLLRKALKQFIEGDNQYEAVIRQLVIITIWYQACFQSNASTYSADVVQQTQVVNSQHIGAG